MKKVAIIAVLLLSTGLAGLSINRNGEERDLKSEVTILTHQTQSIEPTTSLATAD